MLFKNNREIISLYRNNAMVQSIYKGTVLVWQAIRSCFGSGYWINEKPWVNEETWKN